MEVTLRPRGPCPLLARFRWAEQWPGGIDHAPRDHHHRSRHIAEQTRAVYRAIEKVLHVAGAELSDVVKITSFLVTDAEGEAYDEFWRQMAGARREFFPDEGPCGTGVIVQRLVYPGLLIEVECVAVIPAGRPATSALV